MKKSKDITEDTARPGLEILTEMKEMEAEFQQTRDAKKAELEELRQDLISRLKQVDEYMGTSSFGSTKPGKATRAPKTPKAEGEAGASPRMHRGELEKYIKDALAKGPTTIGDLLKRVHEAGLTGKDGSIRSKMGSPKWVKANGITKNGAEFVMAA